MNIDDRQTKKYNTKSKRSKNMIVERKKSKRKRKMLTQRKENINSEQNDMNEKKGNDKRNIRKITVDIQEKENYNLKGIIENIKQQTLKTTKGTRQRSDGLRKDKKCTNSENNVKIGIQNFKKWKEKENETSEQQSEKRPDDNTNTKRETRERKENHDKEIKGTDRI